MESLNKSVEKIETAKFFTIYEVHGDGGDRGVGPVIGYASSSIKAMEMAKGKGFFGSEGSINEVPAILVDTGMYVLKKDHPIDLDNMQATKDAELKAKTLASLSAEQRRVLGFN